MNARKIILSVVIVVMCLFATSMNVSAVDEQQAKEKWPMPNDLQWTEDWGLQWTAPTGGEGVDEYQIEIVLNGEKSLLTYLRKHNSNSAIQSIDTIAWEVQESGDYQFRVRTIPSDRDLYEPSDWTEYSTAKTYVKPENVLPTPSGVYWDEIQQNVIHFKTVEEIDWHCIEIYRIDESGNKSVIAGRYTDVKPDQNGICSVDVTTMLEDSGIYYATVMAMSNNITTVAHSDRSEYSASLVVCDDDTTGSIVYENGKYIYYNTYGQKDSSKTGLVNYNDIWYYVENGEVHPEDTEVHVVNFENSKFITYGGTVLTSANGAFNVPNTNLWYFCSNGQVQSNYNDLALYDGEWFVVENGVINVNYNGIYDYNGGKFFVAAGQLKRAVTGLQQDPISENWYYFANGEVQVNYTGLATYDGEWFYIVKGMLAEDYSGKVKYDGKDFNVVNGMVKY